MSAAAVDVIAIMSIPLTAARFLSNRGQNRVVVSVPKELTEERNIVGRGDELQAGMAAFASREPWAAHFPPHSASRGERQAMLSNRILIVILPLGHVAA